jgi:retron-type reverse transcriptase
MKKNLANNSSGFRPYRSAHQALRRAQVNISDGYKYAIDLDLEQFFDTVNHSPLIELLGRRIEDGRVISLIHKYLRSGVLVGEKYQPNVQGAFQGGLLSPIIKQYLT